MIFYGISSLVIISLLIGLYFLIRHSGVKEERQRNAEETLKSVTNAANIDYDNSIKPINEVKAEMDEKFTRD